jgi:ABC-type glycerol-3-phosphate transport system substrate-binding protein
MKLRPFELALVVIFGVLLIGALVLLRTYKAPPAENVSVVGQVSIWGILPDEAFRSLLTKISETDEGLKKVTYRYIAPEEFDEVLVNALADQTGPDLLLLPHDRLVKHRARLQSVPYEKFPIRDFRTNYIDGATIFALNDGLYGFPVMVDPLVMFWNRDIFSTNGFLTAPTTWEEVVADTVPTITIKDYNRNIERSALAMGEYSNIKNAFPIISLLLLQGGSSLILEDKNSYLVKLDFMVGDTSGRPFTNAIKFFTNFSNTSNTLYSWNRSLALDRDKFLSEDLALYFGFASEGRELEAKNPNLSFDIAEVPQGEAATIKRTYGQFYALAITKTTDNKTGALTAMQIIGNLANAKQLADSYNMVPVHRNSVAVGSNDVYGRIAYKSAVNARGWLNPDLSKFEGVFKEMLSEINSNRQDIEVSVRDTAVRIQEIY